MNTPKLDLIIGCMFSGKTTELLNRIRKAHLICDPTTVLIINNDKDKRYDESGSVCSHDKQAIYSISVDSLISVVNLTAYKKASVVFVDEAQFFPDLKAFALKAVEEDGKWVTICGLDGDFQRNKFGDIIDLIPYADTVYKTTALCLKCKDGTPALFSARLQSLCQDQVLVGEHDVYVPVCRKHYLMNQHNTM